MRSCEVMCLLYVIMMYFKLKLQKKKSLISKYTELKITHILPSILSVTRFYIKIILVSCYSEYLWVFCNVNVWCAGGGFFNLKHLYKISLTAMAQSEVRSNNVTVSRLHFRWWKKINMMKVNFFFVLYVSLIEMLIDNHDYTHWKRNLAIARGKKSLISEIEGLFIIINEYSNMIYL